jgi:hypothetical protein
MFERMQTRTGRLAAGCLIAGIAAFGQAHAASNRAGQINSFNGVDEIVEACTTSKSFVSVPQMTRPFTVSGTASSVVVTFSGSASLNGQPFDTGFVRLTIDGTQQNPGVVPFIGVGETSEANAFTWQSQTLSVGSHTARVQWRTDLGSSFCVDARSLVILHR